MAAEFSVFALYGIDDTVPVIDGESAVKAAVC